MKRSLRSWLWRVPLDQEVDEEIAFHIEMRTRELVERGVDLKTAREIVLARVGDVSRLKRTCVDLGRKRDREMRITQWIEERRDDVKTAFRQMRASPAFTIVAAITLALGIGANSAIFALADATFLRPLPFSSPAGRLVMLWEPNNGILIQTTPLDFKDWSEQNRTFDATAAFSYVGPLAMAGAGGSIELVSSQSVTARFFEVLGVTPVAGRTFLPSDDGTAVVVISEGFWRDRFGADPALIGRPITLGGRAQTVIGVVPSRFQVVPASVTQNSTIASPSIWTLFNPTRAQGPWLRGAHYLFVVGRIKEAVSFDTAQRDMKAIAARNEELYPSTNKGHTVVLQPLREALVGSEMRLTSMLLLGGRRLRAVDVLRQRREPAARAHIGTGPRDRRALGSWGDASSCRRAVAHRESRSCGNGRPHRRCRRLRDSCAPHRPSFRWACCRVPSCSRSTVA
jgi:hypothetical protein